MHGMNNTKFIWSCICSHLRTAICTSPLLWDWPYLRCASATRPRDNTKMQIQCCLVGGPVTRLQRHGCVWVRGCKLQKHRRCWDLFFYFPTYLIPNLNTIFVTSFLTSMLSYFFPYCNTFLFCYLPTSFLTYIFLSLLPFLLSYFLPYFSTFLFCYLPT
jgi:hypothetical protein